MEGGGPGPLDCLPGTGTSTDTRRPPSTDHREGADGPHGSAPPGRPTGTAGPARPRSGRRLTAVPRYREHLPSPVLAPYVRCYWTLRGRAEAPTTRRVVPDACQDILFRFAGPGDGGPHLAVGTMTRPLPVRDEDDADYLGVRFHPWGARPFLGLPARELTDHRVPLGAVWGPAAEVSERLAALPPGRDRLRTLERALLSRIRNAGEGPDAAVRAAVGRLEAGPGGVAVSELARLAGLGRRQLGRRFLDAVGIPPSVAARIVRFQGALSRLHARPGLCLSRLALEAGYCDQAHLTREFRALAGEPPGAYRRRRGLRAPPTS